MTSSAPAAQPQSFDLDALLARITALKAQQRLIQAQLEQAIDQLTAAHQAGDLDASFDYDDWSFSFSQGRLTTTYSEAARAAIQGIQESDIAMGLATEKRGAGFWTIKPPAI